MMGCWNFFRQIEKLTVIIYTSLCQQQPRRRRYSSSMDGRGGGDAVDNILFFSRFFTTLLYLWQNVMRFFFLLEYVFDKKIRDYFWLLFWKWSDLYYYCDVHKKFFSRSWLDMVWTNLMPLTTDKAEDEKNKFLLFRAKCRNNSKKIFNFQSKKQKDVAILLKKNHCNFFSSMNSEVKFVPH